MEYKADVNISKINENYCIHHILKYGTPITDFLKLMIEKKCDIKIKDKRGDNSLHFFAQNKNPNIEIFKFLIEECKLDVSSLNNNIQSCLFLFKSYSFKNFEIFCYLIDQKIDVNLVDVYGFHILHHILRKTDWEIDNRLIKLLLEKKITIDSTPKKNFVTL